jgi:hypothetical protein
MRSDFLTSVLLCCYKLQLPFNFRTERLMKWLGTHPAFKEAGVAIVDDLPATRGFRGVRATKSIKAGAQVFAIVSADTLRRKCNQRNW